MPIEDTSWPRCRGDWARAHQVESARQVLAGVAVGDVEVNEAARTLLAPISGGAADLTVVLREFDTRGLTISDIGLRRPTLDDVFLTLTGHVAEHEPDADADSTPNDPPTTPPNAAVPAEVLS